MSPASSNSFVFVNGVVSPSSPTPTVTTFLESRPGAYTTTRTHNGGSLVLFWDRHLRRLAESTRVLLNASPHLLFGIGSPDSLDSFSRRLTRWPGWEPAIASIVNDSVSKALPVALGGRKSGEELAITALVSGNLENVRGLEGLDEERVSRVLDVCVHVGMYVPPVFGVPENGARLAVVGRGRDVACAKYSDWVRLRKPLEKFRPPLATELLLSNDGDQILEGSVTNFFVVCRKDHNASSPDATGEDLHGSTAYEIQTAPIRDGVLPGVIRQVIIDICSSKGIPVQEVAPSWSRNELWEEAFITNSLRILQHVESIQVPLSWKLLESESEKDVTWVNKQFREAPGKITALIQQEIMKRVGVEGYKMTSFTV